MKKYFFTIVCALVLVGSIPGQKLLASELGSAATSNVLTQTEPVVRDYFPRAGDFGIGFNGTPFLNYLGNMFNGTTNNSLNLGDNVLHFRYFVTDNSAIRLAVRVLSVREVDKFYLNDQAAQLTDPLSRSQVEDMRTIYTNEYELKAGYLMFRGNNRLRGFFGGDLFFSYGRDRARYQYGNKMTDVNPAPETVVNWNTGATNSLALRPLKENSGSNFNIGLGAVTGAEYYLMPKMALGVEMGLVYGYSFFTQTNRTSETMQGPIYLEEDFELEPDFSERVVMSTFPNTFGNLYLMIHF